MRAPRLFHQWFTVPLSTSSGLPRGCSTKTAVRSHRAYSGRVSDNADSPPKSLGNRRCLNALNTTLWSPHQSLVPASFAPPHSTSPVSVSPRSFPPQLLKCSPPPPIHPAQPQSRPCLRFSIRHFASSCIKPCAAHLSALHISPSPLHHVLSSFIPHTMPSPLLARRTHQKINIYPAHAFLQKPPHIPF